MPCCVVLDLDQIEWRCRLKHAHSQHAGHGPRQSHALDGSIHLRDVVKYGQVVGDAAS